ncbi:MAG: hypothetical protein KGL43_26010, partial [Burkholderiales bacterium]|nr:hypothetical protein [Burkholderiales bacterium]
MSILDETRERMRRAEAGGAAVDRRPKKRKRPGPRLATVNDAPAPLITPAFSDDALALEFVTRGLA